MRKVSCAVLLALTACGTARIIQMTPTGGIIELHDDRSKAMEQATHDMNAKCGPNNFTIVKEGYDPLNATDDDPAMTSSGSDAPPHTEWRIHFQCNGAVADPAPKAAAPPDAPPPAPSADAAPTTDPPGY